MRKYTIIKKEFSFLESEYGFKKYMKQKSGSYYYIGWTNEIKNINVFYDETIDKKTNSPIWIKIYSTYCYGPYHDDTIEFRNEFFIPSASPKERIHCAAEWLKNAIENKTVKVE